MRLYNALTSTKRIRHCVKTVFEENESHTHHVVLALQSLLPLFWVLHSSFPIDLR